MTEPASSARLDEEPSLQRDDIVLLLRGRRPMGLVRYVRNIKGVERAYVDLGHIKAWFPTDELALYERPA